MFLHFLRENRWASYLLAALRLYVGWQWLQAGWGKITDGRFDASGFLTGAVHQSSGAHAAVQPWWGDFLHTVAIPNIWLFNTIVPWGEFLVGLGLILGVLTSFAALMGITMNFAYLLSGSTSTNPQLLFLSLFILIAGANSGKIGIDRWIIPYLKKTASEKKRRKSLTTNI